MLLNRALFDPKICTVVYLEMFTRVQSKIFFPVQFENQVRDYLQILV